MMCPVPNVIVHKNGEELKLFRSRYDNNRTALVLIDKLNCPYAVCTINIPECELKDNEVIIKNYSENEGMEKDLYDAGIIGSPKKFVRTGYEICPIAELLI